MTKNVMVKYFRGLNAGQMLIDAILLNTNPGDAEETRELWGEMHSVAHLWAALLDYVLSDYADSPLSCIAPGDLVDFLLRSEKLLDLMQERPDLRHPDPWRCSPEVRALLLEDRGGVDQPAGSARSLKRLNRI